MYHCHHSKGPGGEIPVADGISLGSLWNRSGHSGHPGANISRSLSVERTDRAEYSIFKVLKYFLLYTVNMKFSLWAVTCFFKRRLPGCGSTMGLGVSPQICVWISKRYASKTYWAGKESSPPVFASFITPCPGWILVEIFAEASGIIRVIPPSP